MARKPLTTPQRHYSFTTAKTSGYQSHPLYQTPRVHMRHLVLPILAAAAHLPPRHLVFHPHPFFLRHYHGCLQPPPTSAPSCFSLSKHVFLWHSHGWGYSCRRPTLNLRYVMAALGTGIRNLRPPLQRSIYLPHYAAALNQPRFTSPYFTYNRSISITSLAQSLFLRHSLHLSPYSTQ